ncbi:SMI1 / KNR4 family protein [Gimesia maris]|uniref:SMI1/KNR4 family protein n=1 Tax=Gimesia maris TaxID=122 RepID=UPI001187D6D5|nr:SMI1/KNR4 family protein [Gimesia maris]QDT80280.1 SMI1 / KNR4 family protein [Gimesia maris]
MIRIEELLERISDLTAEDQDEFEVTVQLQDPLSADELKSLIDNIPLPQELCDFYAVTNGMDLLSAELFDADSLQYVQGFITFHSFGNGDFTCIATKKSEYPEGSVLFMNHCPDSVVQVADSLYDWMEKVVAEIQSKGGLLHPADYYRHPDEQGVYSHVLNELKSKGDELHS